MTAPSLRERLAGRLASAPIKADDSVLSGLENYLSLLARWNAKINLTALPVLNPTDAALDKLLIEPLVAAQFVPADTGTWIDLGSGGGSPALPLRLACRQGSLVLVESRERKCAFLREAIRTLGLERTTVMNARFDEFHAEALSDVVTVRAVRIDAEMEALLRRILRVGGLLFCFGTPISSPHFSVRDQAGLPDGSQLTIASRLS